MCSEFNSNDWFSILFDFAKEINYNKSYKQESCNISVKPFAFKEPCESMYLSLANSIYFMGENKEQFHAS